ncbi:hypothetical protein G6F40_016317 [Rhizopus arrhizus]|nr:hypothetical protein G6F40_016317 [Rhizopus arrhizus]
MAAKAVVRDSGRVLGFPYGLVDGVSKLSPNILGIHLKDALGKGKEGPSSEMASAELIQRYETEDDVRDLIDLALQLEDLTRNAGKHAERARQEPGHPVRQERRGRSGPGEVRLPRPAHAAHHRLGGEGDQQAP